MTLPQVKHLTGIIIVVVVDLGGSVGIGFYLLYYTIIFKSIFVNNGGSMSFFIILA